MFNDDEEYIDDSDNTELQQILAKFSPNIPVLSEDNSKKVNANNKEEILNKIRCYIRLALEAKKDNSALANRNVEEFFNIFFSDDDYLQDFLMVLSENEFQFCIHKIAQEFKDEFLNFLNRIKHHHLNFDKILTYFQNCFITTYPHNSNTNSLSEIIAEYLIKDDLLNSEMPIDYPGRAYQPPKNESPENSAKRFMHYIRYMCTATAVPTISTQWLECMKDVIENVEKAKRHVEIKQLLKCDSPRDAAIFIDAFIVTPNEFIDFMKDRDGHFLNRFRNTIPKLFLDFLRHIQEIPVAVVYVTHYFDKTLNELYDENRAITKMINYPFRQTKIEAKDWIDQFYSHQSIFFPALEPQMSQVFQWLNTWPDLLVDFIERAKNSSHWPNLANSILENEDLPKLLSKNAKGAVCIASLWKDILTAPNHLAYKKWLRHCLYSPYINVITAFIEEVRKSSNEPAVESALDYMTGISYRLARYVEGQEYFERLAIEVLTAETPDERWINFINSCGEIFAILEHGRKREESRNRKEHEYVEHEWPETWLDPNPELKLSNSPYGFVSTNSKSKTTNSETPSSPNSYN